MADYLDSLVNRGVISNKAAARMMTHQAEQPNPAQPYLNDVRNFAGGGVSGVLQGRGVKLPGWMNSLNDVLRNPDNQLAMGMMTPLKGAGVRMGIPEAADLRAAENENLTYRQMEAKDFHGERTRVLDKLLSREDFKPSIMDGRMKFKSLTPAENQTMNRIGYSRAPDVEWEHEIDPTTAADAWEKNLRYWRDLSAPPKEK